MVNYFHLVDLCFGGVCVVIPLTCRIPLTDFHYDVPMDEVICEQYFRYHFFSKILSRIYVLSISCTMIYLQIRQICPSTFLKVIGLYARAHLFW